QTRVSSASRLAQSSSRGTLLSKVCGTESWRRQLAEDLGGDFVCGELGGSGFCATMDSAFVVVAAAAFLRAFDHVWGRADVRSRVVAFFLLQRALWATTVAGIRCVLRCGCVRRGWFGQKHNGPDGAGLCSAVPGCGQLRFRLADGTGELSRSVGELAIADRA